MESARKHPLTLVSLVAVASTLGLASIGGAVGVAQDATPAVDPSASPAASPVASPIAARNAVTIGSIDIDFVPAELAIPAATDVTVVIDNSTAQIPHNFAIDALDINETYQAGETVEIVVNAPAGTYEYYCNLPGHKPAGMFGTLIVQ